jgi:hypothetical protein
VELPDIKGRKAIYDVHLKNLKLSGPIDEFSPRLAALTPGFSGADIANICNEAAIHAGRSSKKAIEMIDFEKATDRVIGIASVVLCCVTIPWLIYVTRWDGKYQNYFSCRTQDVRPMLFPQPVGF